MLSPYEYRIGVALKQGQSLDEILRSDTFSPAVVHDYRCDKCGRRSIAAQHARLTATPDILEIDFLRFERVNRGQFRKNSKAVPFTQDLDLSTFTDASNSSKYRLISVVQHMGSFETGVGH